jgi:hypothetical protein
MAVGKTVRKEEPVEDKVLFFEMKPPSLLDRFAHVLGPGVVLVISLLLWHRSLSTSFHAAMMVVVGLVTVAATWKNKQPPLQMGDIGIIIQQCGHKRFIAWADIVGLTYNTSDLNDPWVGIRTGKRRRIMLRPVQPEEFTREVVSRAGLENTYARISNQTVYEKPRVWY